MQLSKRLDFYEPVAQRFSWNQLKLFGLIFIFYYLYTYLLSDKLAARMGVSGFDDSFFNMDTLGILSALLIAPILEEFIFRTHLSGKKTHYWMVLVPVLILLIVHREYWFPVVFFGILLIAAGILDYRLNSHSEFIYKPLFYFMFISTAIVFAGIHYTNIGADSMAKSILVAVMALLPASLIFGYIRYKNGLVYSMLAHAILNLTTLTLNGLIYGG